MAKMTLEQWLYGFEERRAFFNGREIDGAMDQLGDVYDGIWRVRFADNGEYAEVQDKYVLVDVEEGPAAPTGDDFCPHCGSMLCDDDMNDYCPGCGWGWDDESEEDEFDWWGDDYGDTYGVDDDHPSERAQVVADALTEDEETNRLAREAHALEVLAAADIGELECLKHDPDAARATYYIRARLRARRRNHLRRNGGGLGVVTAFELTAAGIAALVDIGRKEAAL